MPKGKKKKVVVEQELLQEGVASGDALAYQLAAAGSLPRVTGDPPLGPAAPPSGVVQEEVEVPAASEESPEPADSGVPQTEVEAESMAGIAMPPTVLTHDFPKAPSKGATAAKPEDVPKSFQGFVAKFLPETAAVRIMIKHLSGPDAGRTFYVNDYMPQDLRDAGSFQAFLQRYIVPEYGYGEYIVELVRQNGTVVYRTVQPVAEPLRGRGVSRIGRYDEGRDVPAFNPMDFFDKVMARTQEQAKIAEEVAERRKKEYIDLYEMAQSKGGMDPAMFMLLFDRMSTKSSADPSAAAVEAMRETVKRMEEEARRERRFGRGWDDRPPELPRLPTLPMPLASEGTSGADMVKAVAEAVKAATPHQQGLSAQDVLAIIAANKPQEKPGMSFGEILQTVTTAVPAVRQLLGIDQQQTILNDLLRELRESRNKPLDLLAEAQKLKAMRDLGREIAGARESELSSTIREMMKAVPFLVTMMRGPQMAQRQQALPPVQPQPQIEQPKKEPVKLLLPADMTDDFRALADAGDEAGIFQAAMGIVGKLATNEQWAPHLQIGLKALEARDRDRSVAFVQRLFGGLAKTGAFPEARVADVVRVFEEQFASLAAMAGGGAS